MCVRDIKGHIAVIRRRRPSTLCILLVAADDHSTRLAVRSRDIVGPGCGRAAHREVVSTTILVVGPATEAAAAFGFGTGPTGVGEPPHSHLRLTSSRCIRTLCVYDALGRKSKSQVVPRYRSARPTVDCTAAVVKVFTLDRPTPNKLS